MSHMTESCHIWLSHVTYEWVMSHMNESWHICMGHVACEWVMSHLKGPLMSVSSSVVALPKVKNESRERVMAHMHNHVTCERVMSHMNGSWHICMSHVTYEWVMSRLKGPLMCVAVSVVALPKMRNDSCERVMAHVHESCHIWMSHVTHMNESCHICMRHVAYDWVMSRMKGPLMCVSVSVVALPKLRHEWRERVMAHLHESCHKWKGLWRVFLNLSLPFQMQGTRSLRWMRLVPCIWREPCIWSSLRWMCQMNASRHISMSHVTHMNESCHTYEWVTTHIWMSHVAHMNESCRTYERVTSPIDASCHTYEWVISPVNESYHIWQRHVTRERVTSHINESCHVWKGHVTYFAGIHV